MWLLFYIYICVCKKVKFFSYSSCDLFYKCPFGIFIVWEIIL